MISDDDELEIPKFLRMTPEERRKAWEDHPPKPPSSNLFNKKEKSMTGDEEKKEEAVAVETAETPGRKRLKASPNAEKIRQGVIAEQEASLETAKKEREDMTATARKKSSSKKATGRKAAASRSTARRKSASGAVRRSRTPDETRIVIVAKENPRTPGSKKHAEFEIAKKAKDYGDYIKRGGTRGSMMKCVSKGWIKLQQPKA